MTIVQFQVIKPFGCGSVRLTKEIPRKVTLPWLISEIARLYPSLLSNLYIPYTNRCRIIDHPNYDNTTKNYDIALLRLSEPVDFSDPSLSHVFPACWPSSEPEAGQRVSFL